MSTCIIPQQIVQIDDVEDETHHHLAEIQRIHAKTGARKGVSERDS